MAYHIHISGHKNDRNSYDFNYHAHNFSIIIISLDAMNHSSSAPQISPTQRGLGSTRNFLHAPNLHHLWIIWVNSWKMKLVLIVIILTIILITSSVPSWLIAIIMISSSPSSPSSAHCHITKDLYRDITTIEVAVADSSVLDFFYQVRGGLAQTPNFSHHCIVMSTNERWSQGAFCDTSIMFPKTTYFILCNWWCWIAFRTSNVLDMLVRMLQDLHLLYLLYSSIYFIFTWPVLYMDDMYVTNCVSYTCNIRIFSILRISLQLLRWLAAGLVHRFRSQVSQGRAWWCPVRGVAGSVESWKSHEKLRRFICQGKNIKVRFQHFKFFKFAKRKRIFFEWFLKSILRVDLFS